MRLPYLSGRLGWTFPVVDSLNVQPFAQYSWQRMNIDDYTESQGPFPASFDSRTEEQNIARLGLEIQYAFSENLDLLTWASWSYRFEDRSGSMSGRLIGLNEFNYSGGIIDKNWGGAGIKFNWRPWKGFKVFSGISCGIESRYSVAPDLALTFGMGWDL